MSLNNIQEILTDAQILNNANAGGTFKSYNIKNYLIKKYFIIVFWKAFEVCY